MNGDGREAALSQQLVESNCPLHRLHEGHNLVEFWSIHKIAELSVLVFFSQLRIILEKTVQRKFGLFVHSDLMRVRNELLAKTSGLRGHRCAEHHHLLLFWRLDEDLSHVFPHIQLVQALATFIEHKLRQLIKLQILVPQARPGVPIKTCGLLSISRSFAMVTPSQHLHGGQLFPMLLIVAGNGTSPRGHGKPRSASCPGCLHRIDDHRLRSTSRHSHAVDRVGCTRKVHCRTIAKDVVTLSWCVRSIHLAVQAFIIWLPSQKINELQCCRGNVHLCVPPLSGAMRDRRATCLLHTRYRNTTLSPNMTVGVK